jgi:hypothetical protein
MVSPAERDAAVHQAVATERALAADSQQRAEAGWREKLGMLERQLSHQAAEVQALRAANEKLELAVGTLKVRLCPWSLRLANCDAFGPVAACLAGRE